MSSEGFWRDLYFLLSAQSYKTSGNPSALVVASCGSRGHNTCSSGVYKGEIKVCLRTHSCWHRGTILMRFFTPHPPGAAPLFPVAPGCTSLTDWSRETVQSGKMCFTVNRWAVYFLCNSFLLTLSLILFFFSLKFIIVADFHHAYICKTLRKKWVKISVDNGSGYCVL